MKFTIVSIIGLALIVGCNSQVVSQSYKLTSTEKKMCDSLQVDTNIILGIRKHNQSEMEPFHYALSKMYYQGEETELDPIHLDGFVFKEKNENSYDLVFSLKDDFKRKGYSIFLLENNFDIDQQPDHIGVLKTTDQYAVLKQINTNGLNYDIDVDSLITIIRKFDKQYSLELIGASGDWCEFVINSEPKNWLSFAKEVYKICPDVVDQGTETVEALAEEMKAAKRLYLWWD